MMMFLFSAMCMSDFSETRIYRFGPLFSALNHVFNFCFTLSYIFKNLHNLLFIEFINNTDFCSLSSDNFRMELWDAIIL